MELFRLAVAELSKWLELALQGAKGQRDQQARNLLQRAAMLVTACRALDHSFREIADEVAEFRPDWPDERRTAVIERVRQLGRDELIISKLDHALAFLGGKHGWRAGFGDAIADQVGKLLATGREVRRLVGTTDHTPWNAEQEFTSLLDGLKNARDQGWADATIRQCTECLVILDRGSLREAGTAFGKLERLIVDRFGVPALPELPWAA